MAPDSAGATKYQQYVADVTADIKNCVQNMACQPILFIGSGMSKRFFGGPSWDGLLAHLAASCPLIEKDYAYYKQSLGSSLLIGEEFAKLYHEWAWSTAGKANFPAELFADTVPRIHGELLKLGIDVGQTSVAKYMARRRRPPSQGWRTFLLNQADGIASVDLFVVPSHSGCFTGCSFSDMAADEFSGLTSLLIRAPNGLPGKSPKRAAGTLFHDISFVIATVSTVRYLPAVFGQWAFATDRQPHGLLGRTAMLNA